MHSVLGVEEQQKPRIIYAVNALSQYQYGKNYHFWSYYKYLRWSFNSGSPGFLNRTLLRGVGSFAALFGQSDKFVKINFDAAYDRNLR